MKPRNALRWVVPLLLGAIEAPAMVRVGTAMVDITPTSLPVVVNGGFLSRTADRIRSPLRARALAIADGTTTAVLVVVDSCLLDRVWLDDVKRRAASRTGIPATNLLIAVTHTHSAPAATGALGTDPDPLYPPLLRDRLVEVIAAAPATVEPVLVGFTRTNAAEFTALRRWFFRPDQMRVDPFGNLTVRATMHAPREGLEYVTGETGPEDPALELISFRALDGRPVAVLANFSMHYFGESDGLSADYFGLFCEGLAEQLAPEPAAGRAPFLALLSHGCSGDIWRRDYARPESWDPTLRIEDYARRLRDLAVAALRECPHREADRVRMLEHRFVLRRRTPDRERLEWARRIVEAMGGRGPTNQVQVYAREQLWLHEQPTAEIVVQALRIGEIAIAAHPCEAYALTGLKLKARSPLPATMVIELANGAEGYIPPPEQHRFGGYTTWPARSAALEVGAEPRIVEELLRLLEQAAGRPRRPWMPPPGPAARTVLQLRPLAYWRLNEFTGPHAADELRSRDAVYDDRIAFHLDGPRQPQFNEGDAPNRAPHFAGGRLRVRLPGVRTAWSASLWCWNGMPPTARGVAGWMLSRGDDHELPPNGIHLGVGGTNGFAGRLIAMRGRGAPAGGPTPVERWTWHHVAMVANGQSFSVYLDGRLEIELPTAETPPAGDQWFFGGRSDGEDNWEGRLDEIAVFDRPLSPDEVLALAARR
ncbi:MAG: hypothetical protein N2652_05855 [Kiritimatiellae bacterium]|nr:hypothetical protein [Kiritimatiellia bacterium]